MSVGRTIFQGLVGSAFDVYGKLEARAAGALLTRLRVPEDAPGLRELRGKLAEAGP